MDRILGGLRHHQERGDENRTTLTANEPRPFNSRSVILLNRKCLSPQFGNTLISYKITPPPPPVWTLGTHSAGYWLDAVLVQTQEQHTNFLHRSEIEPLFPGCPARISHYTDWAILAPRKKSSQHHTSLKCCVSRNINCQMALSRCMQLPCLFLCHSQEDNIILNASASVQGSFLNWQHFRYSNPVCNLITHHQHLLCFMYVFVLCC